MRIALFHNLPSGGAKRAVYEWTRRLSRIHKIDVYTLSSADHEFCDIRPYVNHHYIYDFKPHKLLKSPFGRLNQFQRWRDLQSLTRLGCRIARKIRSNEYDVVFSNPCGFTLIPTVLQHIDLPSVYYLHEPIGIANTREYSVLYRSIRSNSLRHLLDIIDPFIFLYKYSLQNIQTNGLKNASLLLANSKYTKAKMVDAFQVKPVVSYLGVNSDEFKPQAVNRSSKSVLSVGEITPRKGYDFLINSLALIPIDKRPSFSIIANWVNPREQKYLEELASNRRVELNILNKLSTKELCREYSAALLCIYAPIQEPFGLVPLESMACGTPVVGVAEGGVKETVVDGLNGRLVNRDPEIFAQAVMDLLQNPDLLSKYGQQARQYVIENWSWDKSIIRLENHLIEAAN